ncbi:aspartyl/asparaginyl beta-hydroxylase domain-containing protein [Sphingomonas sanguinis]|jgi:aspartate beta-hydroxylase|uniref:Aspartyl/asparaginyl beta-hydroxylase domain-containing protein n=3 Tax=Sphingomonas sanguinis TaxID=33051 RepID=A0A7Y7QXQ6_9SPHN|nr:aspartyl/asparaginyl beta-hydroxylase domain-containing protein [Sphingomonas sanguinis]MBZ6383357.1 aspartyl/asparaginyl beta-hydroxylase domain-containing protein [Sphingomonas sanguinis]NNG54207.1 tetratricopeptide repeat protein [Sphingomonas sanguinis]NVP32652.1 aspartyl/asparaginyl beta-hydroxylase domain-containing protein [Sphingomonas sanguinis]
MSHDPMSAINELLSRAEQLARSGNLAGALQSYDEVLALSPENPRALNGLGNRALSRGDGKAAAAYFERAVRSDPKAPPLWLNLALARRMCGDAQGELQALDDALTVDPYFVIALLQKAQWLERYGRRAEAVRAYRALLDAAPPLEGLPPAMRQALEHGQALVDADNAALEANIRSVVGEDATGSVRFDHALEIMAGKRQVYHPKPVGLHFPYLPPVQYFDRALFPWFAELEAAAPVIRRELEGLVAAGHAGAPYVRIAAGQPENQWKDLNNSLDWSAMFLWRDGKPVQEVQAQCPMTADLLRRIPMLDIPNRGPTAMFSTLQPHTRIPPHHGVTNVRSVVHLPLIVPEGCGFRVGSETRHWQEGGAWAFDDTIEHEAWNDSGQTRVILIIDAWNPYLTEAEKDLLRKANEAMHQFGQGQV